MSNVEKKAGETRGQVQGKAEELAQSTKDATNTAKNKTVDTAQSAKNKTVDTAQSAQNKTADAAQCAKNKTADTTQSATESAQQGKDQSGGFLQQKGEQVMNMAQGAVGTVKNTLGMGDKKWKKNSSLSLIMMSSCINVFRLF